MDKLLHQWTSEKITGLAPDQASVKSARKLAAVDKWLNLGHDEYTVWGEYKGSASSPYEVKLDLLRLHKGEPGYDCTCPSRKHPCKHTLALLYITIEQFDAVPQQETPVFIQEWLDKDAVRARKDEEKKKRQPEIAADTVQFSKTFEERKNRISGGLEELELWLENLIRHGLGDAQIRQYEFWDTKSARMIYAQAAGIATW
ncbi:MAG TPA: SWIM zinc finger family protein, partial [Aggregatilineales bacterium]|nr:SWIM zinc finger family protein [Aggregatilineales bacterium]